MNHEAKVAYLIPPPAPARVHSPVEEIHGFRYHLTQLIWPEIQQAGPSAAHAIHNIYGAMSLASAMDRWDLFDDFKMLVDVAWTLQGMNK